ncbi:Crp/Fnr family transcriptional regulator [Pedobacter sp. MC2016-24]|uniref:Crp/Fnr family transcriptional regulator n=1 Tax=Pedobacter sp. MC2016-24 TaxID=2780090 RepID=UPI00188042E8|nr:cyclic nucleotide-binding domain-containing protein [Pedobacter sp. MC2016-24]MBE9601492.1 cyclic nucleotide-binding domain-containing protein [Pedobacter sp. MC2016-24]
MDKERLITFFHQTNLITPSVARTIAEQFDYKSIAKNQFHLVEGTLCDQYLFLERGYMRAFAHDTLGNEVTTSFYAPGQVVFEVSSFFERTKSLENIQALSDCEGWFITYAQLNTLFHSLPEFREFGRSMLVKGFSPI